MLNSDASDMARAFYRHMSTVKLAGICRRSRVMAYFYAAECGLKYLFMHKSSASGTNELVSKIKNCGLHPPGKVELHDLEMLCNINAILPVDTGTPPGPFSVSAGSPVESFRIHEAARYGIKVCDAYMQSVENWLDKVTSTVATRIKQIGAHNDI